MIGYALEVTVWQDGEDRRETAILTLDLDGDAPLLDLRLASGGGDVIVNVDPEDAYAAFASLDRAAAAWRNDREAEKASA